MILDQSLDRSAEIKLSRKAFETNSLKQTFVLDVWFHGQIVYSNIEHLSNIDEIVILIVKYQSKFNFIVNR